MSKLSNELLSSHLRLVETIANNLKRSLPRRVALDDLIGAGMLGLLDAARKFDPQKRVPFRLYAARRIRGAILDSLRDLDTLPRTMRRHLRVVEYVSGELTQSIKRFPNDEEIAEGLKLPLKQWQKVEQQLFDAGCPVNHQGSSLKPQILPENLAATQDGPEQWVIRQELRLTLSRAVGSLPDRYQEVVWLYYFCQRTMKQIGRHMGISEGRVSQIHSAAIRRMRSHLNDNGNC